MMRVSPPELAREFPGPHASSNVTWVPFRSRWRAVQPPNAPAPTTAMWGFRLGDANEVDIERAATFNRDLRFMRTAWRATGYSMVTFTGCSINLGSLPPVRTISANRPAVTLSGT